MAYSSAFINIVNDTYWNPSKSETNVRLQGPQGVPTIGRITALEEIPSLEEVISGLYTIINRHTITTARKRT
jgi:hypothetical protein